MNDEDVARDPWRGVYHALRAAIGSGEYPPGSRLVEQQLADRFRTSRGPVRTALHELERSGLVVSIDRRGTFVRSIRRLAYPIGKRTRFREGLKGQASALASISISDRPRAHRPSGFHRSRGQAVTSSNGRSTSAGRKF